MAVKGVTVLNAIPATQVEVVSWQSRLASAGLLLLAHASLVVLFLENPQSWAAAFPCPWLALTGTYCPGCGTLRGLHQLLRGNLIGAIDYNPLMVASLPLLGWYLLSYASIVARGRPLPGIFVPARWIWALLAVIVGFWILRNLPLFPFSLLAP